MSASLRDLAQLGCGQRNTAATVRVGASSRVQAHTPPALPARACGCCIRGVVSALAFDAKADVSPLERICT